MQPLDGERTGIGRLEGLRVLAVGASAGIGKSFAGRAVELGAQVCVAARRVALVDGAHVIQADLTHPDDCRRLVLDAAARLGGIDLLVHSAGAGALARIEDVEPDSWRHAWEVNLLGPTLVTAAALPHLAADGVVAFLSSEVAGECRWGMSGYASSKAALDSTIRYWRLEHPERRFLRIQMGAVSGTEFGHRFEGELLGTAFERWIAGGVPMTLVDVADVGRQLAEVLAVIHAHPAVDVVDLDIDPRGQPWPQKED